MNVAVIGAGAVGGYYGALLQRAGHEVHFVLRSDLGHVRRHGLRILSPRGGFDLPRVHAHGDARNMPPCDLVLVALKTTEKGALGAYLPHVLKPDGLALTLQNGLGAEEELAALAGRERVLGGLCFICSQKEGPGLIRHLDYGAVTLGALEPAGLAASRLEWLAAEFRAAGVDARITGDLRRTRWRKLLWNIPFNGLSVVLDADTGEIMAAPAGRELAHTLMEETRTAATAQGLDPGPDSVRRMLEDTAAMAPYSPSMRLDFRAGRRMELESIYARPLEAGKAAGVDMPGVRLLLRQLRFLEARGRSA